MANLQTIGIGSTLSLDDVKWLESLAVELDVNGLYTKAIYLRKMVENSNIENITGELPGKEM